ncbi:MAG: hypothetical protein KF701_04570 [Anaerolineales bacterium]|nr:MAG: hypothetical protein KF701_04570 [Anaerolineales bacterium]
MTIRKGTLVVLAGLALLLAACGGGLSTEDAIATGIAQTMQISQLETAAAGGGGGAQATAVPQGGGGGDAGGGGGEATSTLVPTTGPVFITVSQDTNCRSGPSVAYQLVTTILTGRQAEVLKTFPNSEYVVVQNPNGGGDCWLWLRYASMSDFTAYNLPTATQPPTPTATFTPTMTPTPLPSFAGTWTNKTSNGGATYSNSITFNISGNTVSGSTDWTGIPYNFTGTLSADGQQVNGTWTAGGSSGIWQAFLLNHNQFNGNIGGGWSFCGWRGGAGEPGTCLAP